MLVLASILAHGVTLGVWGRVRYSNGVDNVLTLAVAFFMSFAVNGGWVERYSKIIHLLCSVIPS